MIIKGALIASMLAIAIAQPNQTIIQPRRSSCAAMPSFMNNTDRIVGGQTAPKPVPWQVSIHYGNALFVHYCGGAILDAKTILTAAHCFQFEETHYHFVLAGTTDWLNDDNSGQKIAIDRLVWNDDNPFDPDTSTFNILKLSSPLTFNENVQPICLPEANYAPELSGQTCFVSGWGFIAYDSKAYPQNLQYVDVPLITNEKCRQTYYDFITSSMMCTGVEDGKDACIGDDGGALACAGEAGNAVLTGIGHQFGQGCAKHPRMYARVTSALDWIKSNMEYCDGGSPPAPEPPAPTPAPEPITLEELKEKFVSFKSQVEKDRILSIRAYNELKARFENFSTTTANDFSKVQKVTNRLRVKVLSLESKVKSHENMIKTIMDQLANPEESSKNKE